MKLKSTINTSIKGRFGVSVLDSDGNLVEGKQYSDINNVVSHAGAAAIFTPVATNRDIGDFFVAKVGTSSTERTRASTDLGTPLAAISDQDRPSRSSWTEVDNLDGTATYTITYNLPFSLGEIDDTISEVGIYHDAGTDLFFAGQLIKDELGDPTTVTVLSDEQLIVTYVIEITSPYQGVSVGSGNVDADGTSTDYTIYAQPLFLAYTVNSSTSASARYENEVNAVRLKGSDGTTTIFQKSLGSSTVAHDGSGTVTWNNGTITFAPSDFNSSDVKYAVWAGGTHDKDIDTGTVTEESDSFGSGGLVIVEFDPAISKPSDKTLSFEVDFSISV